MLVRKPLAIGTSRAPVSGVITVKELQSISFFDRSSLPPRTLIISLQAKSPHSRRQILLGSNLATLYLREKVFNDNIPDRFAVGGRQHRQCIELALCS